MTDQRFEDWWSRSPARVALSPAAKEVARGVWQAARDDLVAELNGGEPRQPAPKSPDLYEALWTKAMLDLRPALDLVQQNHERFGAECGDDKFPIIANSFVTMAANWGIYLKGSERVLGMPTAHSAPYVKRSPC